MRRIAPKEPPRVSLPLEVDAAGIVPMSTDLGYEVELMELRISVEDFEFTIAGEVHETSLMGWAGELLIPSAWGHPGHYQGGDVTGELMGHFDLDWIAEDGRNLGDATLIVGTYSAANFTFARADASKLEMDDPFGGHTALLAGVARRDGDSIAFRFVIDSPEDRSLVGAPFEVELVETDTAPLRLRFETIDPIEGDTLFDGIDFAAIDEDADGQIEISPEATGLELDAYNQLRRTLQSHDHYRVEHEA